MSNSQGDTPDRRAPATPAEGRDPTAIATLPRVSPRRVRAEEWALVLSSQGIASRIRPAPGGFVVQTRAEEAARAEAELSAYERENPYAAKPVAPDDMPPSVETAETGWPAAVTGAWIGAGMVGFHAWIHASPQRLALVDLGSANAARITGGEWWRCVTALTLHIDLAHVFGNAISALYFVSAVCAARGVGVGLASVLAAGALGNGVNALVQPRSHDAVGASTAVFGAIGLLAGLALAQRFDAGVRGARLLHPIGAGFALFAMLGTGGPRVDLWAHFFGLFAGSTLAFAIVSRVRNVPAAGQWLLGTLSASVVVACWGLALCN